MALTPALGELAEYVGNKLDVVEAEEAKETWFGGEHEDRIDYDVNITDEAKIQEAFNRFDKDGNGEITAEELQNIFTLVGERGKKKTFNYVDITCSISVS